MFEGRDGGEVKEDREICIRLRNKERQKEGCKLWDKTNIKTLTH